LTPNLNLKVDERQEEEVHDEDDQDKEDQDGDVVEQPEKDLDKSRQVRNHPFTSGGFRH
jgi:hypothetical protein